MIDCECTGVHQRKRIVLTGGPGAGKTAILELIRQSFCRHVTILPEAATIVFGGGFPREDDAECRRAAQRAIFHVQHELEATGDAHDPAIVLCDRGTIDGLAYWPDAADRLWSSVGTTLYDELHRYDAVIHLETPTDAMGYNHQNPVRTEPANVAGELDRRIQAAWAPHPRRFIVRSREAFLEKAREALGVLRSELPACCRRHVVAGID